ncbi:hypothetical protein Sjap_007737 [Stephania japonica]|uniref:Uncharacterized protein n=1 Tax=Stephania japonica TaxID=461633 RepID=A0AAP0JN74_9MAGN
MESSKEELKVKVLEETQVAPPPLALTKASLPLTYFDLPLLLIPPPEMLFYKLPNQKCCNWLALSIDLNIPLDQAVATFVLTRSDIERLRKSWTSMALSTNSITTGALQYPSRFELACAYVLVCLAKSPNKTSDHDNEEITSLVFPVDCRARLDPPIPATYFGNCFVGVEVSAKKRDIVGEDGIARKVKFMTKAKESIYFAVVDTQMG